VISRQFARRETHATIHAEVRITAEECLIVQRRNIVVARVTRIAGVSDGGDNRVDLEHRTLSAGCVHTTVQSVESRATGICDLLLMVESSGFLVIDPFQGHAGDIGAQDQLRQSARRRARDYAQVILVAVVGAV